MQLPSTLSKDLLASVVVFLVALPLCMGIAIASGVPPALGLISGIVGGLVVGFLAGSPLQVTGPAAGLAVLVYELIQKEGLAALGLVILLAGSLQLAAGLLKLGQWFRAISPSVIHGMLAGIGVLIFASQFHVMVDDSPRGGGLANLLSIPEAIYKGIVPLDGSTHHLAAFIGILTIATLVAWTKFRPAGLIMVPPALLAVVVASVAAALLGLPIIKVDVPTNLIEGANFPLLSDMHRLLDPNLILLGCVFAFVASAETLLSAAAVDQMHNGPRTDYDRELAAQGVGNLVCGAFGALPVTGVIVRSGANVQAGAKTRLSAILHGVWLLAAVAALPWVLNHIPTAALAGILVYTGYKLVSVAAIRRIAGYGRAELAIYLVTVVGIVATDLLTGVLLGVALAVGKLIYTFSHLGVDIRRLPSSNRVDIVLHGSATFLGLPRLAAALESVPPGSNTHVHIEELDYIDHACLDLLSSWERQHCSSGGSLKVEWQNLVARYHRAPAGSSPRTLVQQATHDASTDATMASMER